MLSRRTRERLLDIVDDARRIASFIDEMTFEEFEANERTVFAVERLLQRITEAAIQIDPEDAVALGPDVPIPQMRAMGNRLRHEYRDIDRSVVFDIASVEVPALASRVETILSTAAD